MKKGVIYKGKFWPLWGGGNHNKSPRFSSGGIEGLSASILAGNHYASVVTEDNMAKIFRIRKLTARECFRLMGVSDADIDKIKESGVSESQQYKMAGNSIVVQVLEGIFTQLFRVDNESLF